MLDEAIPHIAKQRTQLSGDIAEAYVADVMADYDGIADYLPEHAGAVLDIGCGMAGIDYYLWRRYDCTVHLMDGSGEGAVQAGYHDGALETWNDLNLSVRQLRANGVDDVVPMTPNPDATVPCDVIVSLLSWCHHYPASTYLGLARRSLRSGGRLIVDCRRGTGNKVELAKHFDLVAALPMRGINARKSERCVFAG